MHQEPHVVRFEGLEFNTADLTLSRGPDRIPLTNQSARILGYLIDNRDRTVTRNELIDRFWSLDSMGTDDRLNTCIRRIRSALEEHGVSGTVIETRPRVGYRFVSEIDEIPRETGFFEQSRHGRAAGIGIATLVAVVAVTATDLLTITTGPEPDPSGATYYRNDGYMLQKVGRLDSNCDFEFEGGPGQCLIVGSGVVTFSYKDRFLLRVEVTEGRDVMCHLGDGEVSCS